MPPNDLTLQVHDLNQHYSGAEPQDILRGLHSMAPSEVYPLVSSFGADSAVLLHMVSRIDRHWPIIFIDTQMLFAQTLAYQSRLASEFGLENIARHQAAPQILAGQDTDDLLHRSDPDTCCRIRKTDVLTAALRPYSGWITGRKRHQATTRGELELFEPDPITSGIKVNPLAFWTTQQVAAYFTAWDLPRHPMVARGYPSIGCAPCTSPVKAGEDPRSGRWRGRQKTECGIHLPPPTTQNRHPTKQGELA